MPKKTETIELRLPFETKQAFMARCRATGVSASAELRAFIADYVDRPPRRGTRLAAQIGLAAGALLAVGVLAEPSLARAEASATYAVMDAHHDGRVTFAEFARVANPQVSLGGGFSQADGRLSGELRTRILREAFDRLDANHDGVITLEEFRGDADRR
jgi:hypothetical protein